MAELYKNWEFLEVKYKIDIIYKDKICTYNNISSKQVAENGILDFWISMSNCKHHFKKLVSKVFVPQYHLLIFILLYLEKCCIYKNIFLHTSVESLLETVFSKADEQYSCKVLRTGKDWETVNVESFRGPTAMREVCFKYFTTFLKESITIN